MRLLRRFNGQVRHLAGSTVVGCRGPTILLSRDNGASWRTVTQLPLPPVERAAAGHRLTRRLLRASVHHVVPLDAERWLCVAGKRLFHVFPALRRAVALGEVKGSRPLTVCHHNGTLYYGRYDANPRRRPVPVFASSDGGVSFETIYEFDGVRHVHGVFADPYDDEALWLTTGDADGEAALWVSRDGLRTVEAVLRGPSARVVQPLFTSEYIYYGTDLPNAQNYICRLPRRGGPLERLRPVGGTVFYGYQDGPRLFFGTVSEPGTANEGEARVWASGDGLRWRSPVAFRKDRWPMKLFQYGQVQFPGGSGLPGILWLSPFGVERDQWSLMYETRSLFSVLDQ